MFARHSTVPSVSGGWLLGSTRERRRDPIAFFEQLGRLGPIARYRVLWYRAHFVNHPEYLHHILVDNAVNYVKGVTLRPGRALFGNGLLTAEGADWQRNRRIAQPAFRPDRMSALLGEIDRTITEMIELWQARVNGEPFDVAPEMARLATRIVTRVLLGTDLGQHDEEIREALDFSLAETNRRILDLNPARLLPTQRNRTFKRSVRAVEAHVYHILAARRRSDTASHDLLGRLMAARDPVSGEGMTDRQLRDEVFTLFGAAHDTTANSLSWAIYAVAKHPQVQSALRDEACSVPADDLAGLRYARRVVLENLRLYPPAWLFARQSIGPDRIGAAEIPAGGFLVMSPYVLHRSPEFWERPLEFDPDRFRDGEPSTHRTAYLPFGIGPRTCIGNHLAMAVSQLLLARLAARFQVTLRDQTPVEPLPQLTLRPRDGVWIRLSRAAST